MEPLDALLKIWKNYQGFGFLAFIVTVFATPVAIRAAQRLGVMDYPDQKLKPHAKPTPYLGGAAICLGWALGLLWAMLAGVVPWQLLLPILLGGVSISTLGLLDDMYDIPPKVRLLAGTLIIALVLLTTGAGQLLAHSIYLPIKSTLSPNLSGAELDPPKWLAMPVSFLLSLFIVLGACNSANLIDGLDGLCTGVTAIISLGFFVLASHLAFWDYSPKAGDPARLVLAIAMVGAAMGFLPFNFNPAKIFMGDAGSMLLGYNCGLMILLFAERRFVRWVIAALLIFALPVFDTALAIFRRWRSGKPIFAGDRSHFYDQLRQRGFTVRQTVLICYALTILYCGLGLLTMFLRTWQAAVLFVAVVALTAFFAWISGLTNPEERTAK